MYTNLCQARLGHRKSGPDFPQPHSLTAGGQDRQEMTTIQKLSGNKGVRPREQACWRGQRSHLQGEMQQPGTSPGLLGTTVHSASGPTAVLTGAEATARNSSKGVSGLSLEPHEAKGWREWPLLRYDLGLRHRPAQSYWLIPNHQRCHISEGLITPVSQIQKWDGPPCVQG